MGVVKIPVLVDTVTLLKLIHDAFALSKEKNDAVYTADQSLLSILVYHLRHPMAELDEVHAQTIRFLEAEVKRSRPSGARRRRTGTAG